MIPAIDEWHSDSQKKIKYVYRPYEYFDFTPSKDNEGSPVRKLIPTAGLIYEIVRRQ